MRALKINSELRIIEEVQINDWREISKAIGNNCDTIAAPVQFDNNDTIYVDDEGLFHPFNGGYMFENWSYPIVGNGIIQGTDDEGESTEPITTKEELEKTIIWVDKAKCEQWASNFI